MASKASAPTVVAVIDPNEASRIIGIPLEQWPGNCFAIASSFVRAGLVKGKARYGAWLGPIAPGNQFSGRPLANHGWVEQDGAAPWLVIVDPTRWVFESVDPYIYIGPSDHYDKGGRKLREMVYGPKVPPPVSGKPTNLTDHMTPGLIDFCFMLLGRPAADTKGLLYTSDMFYLGNINPDAIGFDQARDLYRAFDKADHNAVIPMDNYEEVMRG